MLDVVNEKDEVIGEDHKSQKAAKGFISRVAAVFLCDLDGYIYICKRAAHKKFSPNLYDLAAVGAVLAGESYKDAAKRELKEELDIDCDLVMLNKFYQEAEQIEGGEKLKYFCAVFFGKTNAEPKLNEELSEIKKVSFASLKSGLENDSEKFCPGFINDFNQIKGEIEKYILNIQS